MAMSWKRRWNSVRVAAAVCAVLVMMPAGLLRADDPAGGAAVGSKTKRLFWKVVSPTTEVYFLGSVHLATEDFYPLPAEIEAAYKKADVLLVEADVTKSDPATMAVMVMQQGMYPQGDSLDKHISPETMKALTAFCKDNQVPPALITVMKPAMVALTVEAAQAEKTGMKPELGIDMHFLNQANTDKKRIQELESADGQIKLIMGLDDKLADKFLADTLKESSGTDVEKLVKAWKAGDEKTIETLMLQDAKDADEAKINALMLDNRNVDMVKKIEELLKGKEKGFVVVGAAHLIGEKGILKALEKDKYTVERPELTVPARPAATAPAELK